MTCRIDSRRRPAPPDTSVRPPAIERPRHVDAYIDYFGGDEAHRAEISSDTCGEWWLDGRRNAFSA